MCGLFIRSAIPDEPADKLLDTIEPEFPAVNSDNIRVYCGVEEQLKSENQTEATVKSSAQGHVLHSIRTEVILSLITSS